jgi:Tfp pilus assembly protein PilF
MYQRWASSALSVRSPNMKAHRLMRAGRFNEALPFAQHAVAGSRICLPAHGLLATILMQIGRAVEADEVVTHAVTLGTGMADAYDALAHVSMCLGRHERAATLYRRATTMSPQTPRFWYNLACCERNLGRLEAAEDACDRAIALDVTEFPSYLLRSELRVQDPSHNHVEEMWRQLSSRKMDQRARVFLGFALGKELDDLQRFDEAFACFSDAARARRSRLQYDVAVDEHKLRRIAEAYPSVASNTALDTGRDSRFVFIVGLPRSGTTLVERILTGLAGVRSNGETDNFAKALMSATRIGAGDMFERAAVADIGITAACYARRANSGDSQDAIIEKLPMNYLYLGAIRRALPNAKVLWVRRSALDSCFAMYRTLFGEAYPFTYDFEELARYYAAHERLMAHWRSLCGGDIHEIVYEELVLEPSRVGSAAAGHCNLPWREEALRIQENASASLTASAAQVRRPIYGTSSGRWRSYHRHLGGLIQRLRAHGVGLPSDA